MKTMCKTLRHTDSRESPRQVYNENEIQIFRKLSQFSEKTHHSQGSLRNTLTYYLKTTPKNYHAAPPYILDQHNLMSQVLGHTYPNSWDFFTLQFIYSNQIVNKVSGSIALCIFFIGGITHASVIISFHSNLQEKNKSDLGNLGI